MMIGMPWIYVAFGDHVASQELVKNPAHREMRRPFVNTGDNRREKENPIFVNGKMLFISPDHGKSKQDSAPASGTSSDESAMASIAIAACHHPGIA